MQYRDDNGTVYGGRGRFFYGWVIVAAACLLLVFHTGVLQSFGVFFKPMIADFGWSRAATSGVYSVGLIVQGLLAIPIGWAADRFGPRKVVACCALAVGLGLVLAGQVTNLWQFYLTRGLIIGVGLSGSFSIASATTTRWFTRRRGVALGIVSAGAGVGTLVIVPASERLIAAFEWPSAYVILGVSASAAMLLSAFLLRRNPADSVKRADQAGATPAPGAAITPDRVHSTSNVSLRSAARSRPLLMLFAVCLLFGLGVQMIVVHLVNYATDQGITPLMAATFMSVVGISSVCGRLAMGAISDRIGSVNALAVCCVVLIAAMPWLIFAREPWTFYIFAVVFGFAHGGEVPQIPSIVARFFGLRSLSMLLGTIVLGICLGGALGSWIAGFIYDATSDYLMAFGLASVAVVLALMGTLLLRAQSGHEQSQKGIESGRISVRAGAGK